MTGREVIVAEFSLFLCCLFLAIAIRTFAFICSAMFTLFQEDHLITSINAFLNYRIDILLRKYIRQIAFKIWYDFWSQSLYNNKIGIVT